MGVYIKRKGSAIKLRQYLFRFCLHATSSDLEVLGFLSLISTNRAVLRAI